MDSRMSQNASLDSNLAGIKSPFGWFTKALVQTQVSCCQEVWLYRIRYNYRGEKSFTRNKEKSSLQRKKKRD